MIIIIIQFFFRVIEAAVAQRIASGARGPRSVALNDTQWRSDPCQAASEKDVTCSDSIWRGGEVQQHGSTHKSQECGATSVCVTVVFARIITMIMTKWVTKWSSYIVESRYFKHREH